MQTSLVQSPQFESNRRRELLLMNLMMTSCREIEARITRKAKETRQRNGSLSTASGNDARAYWFKHACSKPFSMRWGLRFLESLPSNKTWRRRCVDVLCIWRELPRRSSLGTPSKRKSNNKPRNYKRICALGCRLPLHSDAALNLNMPMYFF